MPISGYYPAPSALDLVAIAGSHRLFVSTVRRCVYFDREQRQFSPHDVLGDKADIKSYSLQPRTGRLAYIQAERPN